jgi:RNA polymerase sigma-70 factor (ECF subfamily)
VDWVRKRVQSKKEASSDSFFRAHSQDVYAYAARRVGDLQAAEDITAEVFLEAVKNGWLRRSDEPLPWLYGIARRKVADQLRRASRRPQGLTDAIPFQGDDPQAAAESAEQSADLRRLVNALPPDQREALLLHYSEGLTAKQIGTAMKRSAPAINSLLQRARQTLREKGAKEMVR